MKSVEILIKEHDNILQMLDVLHQASIAIMRTGEVNTDDLRKMIEFIRNYADRMHHGKEEEYLFQVMMKELGRAAEKVVRNGMLVEHDLGRLYVSNLETALIAFDKSPMDENRWAVLVAAGSYEQLLRRHIDKENKVVFTFGANNLSAAAVKWIDEQVQAFEADGINEVERKKQLQVLAELHSKYVK